MGLMHSLLARLDGLGLRPGATAIVSGHDEDLSVGGYSAFEIDKHLILIKEAGLVESPGSQPAAGGITFRAITNAGYDFLAKHKREEKNMISTVGQTEVLRQISDTLTDLRRSEFNTFGRHIKRLSRLLHSPELGEISEQLTADLDIETWLDRCQKEDSGMGGSELDWPHDPEKELGTCILLIDRFADDPSQITGFAHEFYYINQNNITLMVRNVVEQMIVPFARDYSAYVEKKFNVSREVFVRVPMPTSKKIFIVHGRDEIAKNKVELFIRTIDLEPIILHLRPNRGRHLLMKFREESEGASFAVVLMTPDDVGGLAGEDLKKRARQNVVFELGFFIGILGSANVAALISAGVERPSDFDGIGYINFDIEGAWKVLLAREMSAAGVPFDPNLVLNA